MPEITTQEIREYLDKIRGKEITLSSLRREFNILPGSKSFNAIRNILFQLAEQQVVRSTGKRDGSYKVITPAIPVPIFSVSREDRPPVELNFPRDSDTGEPMSFGGSVVIREGDLILISGMSNYGKTTLCLSFCAENVELRPVLLGNEYTSLVDDVYVPSPRFLSRLRNMSWVQWLDGDNKDKVVLLPVRDDYAEHIVKNKINIIDWINIESGEHYMIGTVLEHIKRRLGRGIAIIAIQKAEGTTAGRGGQFTKDFADLELLIDKLGTGSDVLLTIGKVKEYTEPVIGKTFAYSIADGVRITNFRQVKKCYACHGHGEIKGSECSVCSGMRFINT